MVTFLQLHLQPEESKHLKLTCKQEVGWAEQKLNEELCLKDSVFHAELH